MVSVSHHITAEYAKLIKSYKRKRKRGLLPMEITYANVSSPILLAISYGLWYFESLTLIPFSIQIGQSFIFTG